MRRKYLIVTLFVAITIFLIVSVRYVIERDNSETQNARLDFYTEFIGIQWGFITNTLESTTHIILSEINNDTELSRLVSDFNNESFSQKMNQRLNEIQPPCKKHLVPTLKFTQTTKFSLDQFSKKAKTLFIDDSTGNKLQPDKAFALTGFYADSNFFGYKVIFPVFNSTKKSVGQIELCYGIESIKRLFVDNLKKEFIGFLYVSPSNSSPAANSLSNQLLINEKFEDIYSDKGFDLNWLQINDTQQKKELYQFLNQENAELVNFSLLSNATKIITISTFKEVSHLNNTGKVFLVSINQDPLLQHTKHLNNNLFIIYLIIVSLGMAGITYLILNRIHIIRQNLYIKRSEQKLLELNTTKDKFFSIVAHDLKNPFNGIMGMSGYLTSDYDNIDDEERKEIINDINISSKNAYNLLQNLLEWTRAQNGYIKNNPEIIDPSSSIELALETVSNLAKNKQIEIVKTIKTKAKGWADENLLTTVIRNLATNAVKFSPRNSTIEIMVKDFKKELVFCVIDKGIGLHEDEIDKLFRIDVNFHKLGTEKETGTGLGLKLCKEFVEYCGGKIWVVSEPGQGCAFYFTIPKNPTSPA
jgi:signal transduction histidine kinase